MWGVFFEIALGFFAFSFVSISSEATKHIIGRTFDRDIFWKTNVKPFLWTTLAGLIIAAYSVYLPEYTFFIQGFAGGEELNTKNMAALYLSASTLGAVLKAVIGKPTEQAKIEIANKRASY